MDLLPYEIRFKILLGSDFEELLELCITDKTHYQTCNSEEFWEDKIEYDFPFNQEKPLNITYFQWYIILYMDAKYNINYYFNKKNNKVYWDEFVNEFLIESVNHNNLNLVIYFVTLNPSKSTIRRAWTISILRYFNDITDYLETIESFKIDYYYLLNQFERALRVRNYKGASIFFSKGITYKDAIKLFRYYSIGVEIIKTYFPIELCYLMIVF